jgi:hypothetical protein
VHAVNGSQYVCALPQCSDCDTMQCYHTVRPRDYHQIGPRLQYVLDTDGRKAVPHGTLLQCYRVLNEQINPPAKAAFQSVATQQRTMLTGLSAAIT